MNKSLTASKNFFKFFRNVFRPISEEERLFRSEYDQLKMDFLSCHSSMIEFDEKKLIRFKDGKEVSRYSEHCKTMINTLDNGRGENLDTARKFKLLKAVKRHQIMEFDNYECDIMIKRILIESSKLDNWRKDAIVELLNEYKDKATDEISVKPVRTSLREAAYIYDVYFDNFYYKSKIAKRTIRFLNWVLVMLLSTFLIYSALVEYGIVKPTKEFILGSFSDLWVVILFGLLGAAFSTLLHLYKSDRLKNKVIKQIDPINLTTARLIIGASAGLIVFLILGSGLITITGVNQISTTAAGIPVTLKPLTIPMLSLIFVAGFTERLVLNFIDKISAQSEKQTQGQDQDPRSDTEQNKNKTTGSGQNITTSSQNAVTTTSKNFTASSTHEADMEIKATAEK